MEECIEVALDRSIPDEKEEFYSELREYYNIDKSAIPDSYPVFHLALEEKFGQKHHSIEREIIKSLHKCALNGEVELREEIGLILLMIDTYLNESDEELKRIKEKLKK